MNKTQEALKMAIEALECEQAGSVRWYKALRLCKKALESQGQDPVAYILRNEYNEYRLEPLDSLKITDFPIEVEIKLYTHPAQPLSDDEISKLTIDGNADEYDLQFARAIEKAHGIGD